MQPLNSWLSKHLEQTQNVDMRVIHVVIALDLAHRANQLSSCPLIETCFMNEQVSHTSSTR